MDTLRIWWIPQVPMDAFYQQVSTPKEAKAMLELLACYDQFQFENNVKPDYSNAGGLQEYDQDEHAWIEWENGNGENIDDVEF